MLNLQIYIAHKNYIFAYYIALYFQLNHDWNAVMYSEELSVNTVLDLKDTVSDMPPEFGVTNLGKKSIERCIPSPVSEKHLLM